MPAGNANRRASPVPPLLPRPALLKTLAIVAAGACFGLAHAAGADCRDCHFGTHPEVDAPDFSEIFAVPGRHHPVGVPYPAAADGGFNRPTGRVGELVFFDRNGNGIADDDEIRLFGAGEGRVECASCHREHGDAPPPAPSLAAAYLRLSNARSALCAVCHRQ